MQWRVRVVTNTVLPRMGALTVIQNFGSKEGRLFEGGLLLSFPSKKV